MRRYMDFLLHLIKLVRLMLILRFKLQVNCNFQHSNALLIHKKYVFIMFWWYKVRFLAIPNVYAWTAAFYNTYVNYYMTAAGVLERRITSTFPIQPNFTYPATSIHDQCIFLIGNQLHFGACNFDKPVAYPLCDDLVINKRFVYVFIYSSLQCSHWYAFTQIFIFSSLVIDQRGKNITLI